MPNAPLRPCAGGCGALVPRGRCASCTANAEARRGSAHDRGYDRAWQAFRRYWLATLVAAGRVPICGARLPDGPLEDPTACQAAQLSTYTSADGSSLHLDHVPELADWERRRPDLVCDPKRIVLKCAECHNRKTAIAAAARRADAGGVS